MPDGTHQSRRAGKWLSNSSNPTKSPTSPDKESMWPQSWKSFHQDKLPKRNLRLQKQVIEHLTIHFSAKTCREIHQRPNTRYFPNKLERARIMKPKRICSLRPK
jgi:hypothetical protein